MEENDNYDLKNMMITKKGKSYITYILGLEKQFIPLKFKFNNVKIPFGIEKYNYKYIINIEFIKNNTHMNYVNNIKAIDSVMKNLYVNKDNYNKISNDFKENIKNKQYSSCLREKVNMNPLLRTHLKMRSNKIITTINNTDNIMNLKNNFCNIDIQLTNIWSTPYNYGFVIYINNIDIL